MEERKYKVVVNNNGSLHEQDISTTMNATQIAQREYCHLLSKYDNNDWIPLKEWKEDVSEDDVAMCAIIASAWTLFTYNISVRVLAV